MFSAGDANLQAVRKAKKMREFRQFLVQSDVVMAFVKYLISIREASPSWPEDPADYLKDFFGQYRDPLWDEIEHLQTENQQLRDSVPPMEADVESLERQIEDLKVTLRIKKAWRTVDPNRLNEITYKALIQRFTGQNIKSTQVVTRTDYLKLVFEHFTDPELRELFLTAMETQRDGPIFEKDSPVYPRIFEVLDRYVNAPKTA
eukprot:GILK01005562.1.p1 GENE.GILK01005562.1~~GILK01005562.1.p1  ORF type:complete len:203 (-),score=35.73 GILK01005562.1:22-630(-)